MRKRTFLVLVAASALGVMVAGSASAAEDVDAPTITIDAPEPGKRGLPLVVRGTVSDDSGSGMDTGISKVVVDVRDQSTGLWWNGAGWQPDRAPLLAVLNVPNAVHESVWSLKLEPVGAVGKLRVRARAVDNARNQSPRLRKFVKLYMGSRPDIKITYPTAGGVAPSAFIPSGTARDNTGITLVQLGVQNDLGDYWNGASWQPAEFFVDADLVGTNSDDPTGQIGTISEVNWYRQPPIDFSSDPTNPPYTLTARVFDDDSNMREKQVVFDPIVAGTESPVVELTNPDELAPPDFQPAGSPFLIVGTASDDRGVAKVELEIVDRYSTLSWDQGAFVNLGVAIPQGAFLTDPGATSTQFVFGPIDPEAFNGTGIYDVLARVTDTDGNTSTDQNPVFTGFIDRPVGDVLSPVFGAVLHEDLAVITGIASADAGIDKAGLIIKDLNQNKYLTDLAGQISPSWAAIENQLGAVQFPVGPGNTWSFQIPASQAAVAAGNTLEIERLHLRSSEGVWSFKVFDPPIRFTIGTDTVDPTVTIDYPVNSSFAPYPIEVHGTAFDLAGVGTVALTVIDLASGDFWDGSAFGPGIKVLASTLDYPGASNPQWSYELFPTGPGSAVGPFEITAVAGDINGNASAGVESVITTGLDTAPPTVALITSPPDGSSVELPNILIEGTAEDNANVTRVRVSLKDTVSGLFWNGDAFDSPKFWFEADMDTPGLPTTDFSLLLPNPFDADGSGSYQVRARVSDSQGQQISGPKSFFDVDKEAPTLTIESPVDEEIVSGTPVPFEVLAEDDAGLDSMQIRVRESGTAAQGCSNRHWNGTTFQASEIFVPVPLPAPGATLADFVFNLFPAGDADGCGDYQGFVQVFDEVGNSSGDVVFFSVDEASPETVINVPAPNDVIVQLPFNVGGTATDDIVVESVSIGIEDLGTNLWFDGTKWVNQRVTLPASCVFCGERNDVNWQYVDVFDPDQAGGSGMYRVFAAATDGAGREDPTPDVHRFAVDVDPPEITVTAPIVNQILENGVDDITGFVTDDVGVSSVEISIIRLNTGPSCGLNFAYWDGDSWIQQQFNLWLPVTALDPPGSTTFDFEYTDFVDPASAPGGGACGRYRMTVRATDVANRVGVSPSIDFNVDEEDPIIAITAPPDGSSFVAGDPVQVSGTAMDDVEVSVVELLITDTGTGNYWDGTDSWVSERVFLSASLSPGPGPTVNWSLDLFTGGVRPSAVGPIAIQAFALDAVGNTVEAPTRPKINET